MYRTILADPPWYFKMYSEKGKYNANRHYDCMKISDIKRMRPLLDEFADKDCVLFMWATYPMLPRCIEVMEDWGFKYKTVAFTWVKLNKDESDWMGMGYWTRANAEICLLGTRGRPKRQDGGVRQLIMSKRREHSRKPDEQYERIERLVQGPYLEMFARPPHREGWDVWGNEAEGGLGNVEM